MAEFFYGKAAQDEGATIFDVPSSFDDYIDAKVKDSGLSTPIDWINNLRATPTGGEVIQKSLAQNILKNNNFSFNIPDEGISSNEFYFKLAREYERRDLQQTIERGPDTTVANALGLAASFGPQLADPLNLATGLIPIVGPARYASMIGKATTPLGRLGVRAGLGAAEAGVGTALLEPISYTLANAVGDDYTTYDSFMNIAFGIGLGAAFSGGGGAIADQFGGGAGVARHIPKVEKAQMIQAAGVALVRDGDVDIDALISASLKKNLLTSTTDAFSDPNLAKLLKDGTRLQVNDYVARTQLQKEGAPIYSKISEAEAKVSTKNIYERALEEYDAATKMSDIDPNTQMVKEKKLQSLEKRYGEVFTKEANDYVAYKNKRAEIETTTDKRKLNRLKKDIESLDQKYGGRLSEAYNKKIEVSIEDEAQLTALRGEERMMVSERVSQMRAIENQNYLNEAVKFTKTYNNKPRQKVLAEVDKIDAEISLIKNRTPEQEIADLDEEIADLQLSDAEFAARNKDYELDEINDEDFNVSSIIDAAKNYTRCLMG